MFLPRSCKKPWRKLWLLLPLILTACTSKQPFPEPPPEAAEVLPAAQEKILVEAGESSQPSYSPSGDRLLFVSARRPGHMQPQVYERDLNSGVERRITFQIGSTWHPHYHPKENWIIYSSSTDELKENSPLLTLNVETKPSKLPPPYTEPLEVYMHSLAGGLEIRRITTRPGFDGDARFSPEGKSLIWTRIAKDRAQVVTVPYSAVAAPRVWPGLGENPASYTLSPDTKSAAWVEWDASFGVSRLRLKHGKEIVDVAGDMIVTKADPEFTPDGKWLLWAQKDAQTNLHGIWGYDIDNKCLHHFLFSSEGDRRHPVVSPDMKWLTFTWVSRGRSRIAQVPFPKPNGPCPVSP